MSIFSKVAMPRPQTNTFDPILYDNNNSTATQVRDHTTGNHLANATFDGPGAFYTNSFGRLYSDQPSQIVVDIDSSTNYKADLSQATASSINDLRRAFRLQEWLERNARGGTRYIEIIMAHFGVRSSDARLQRPEFAVFHTI